MKNRQIPDLIAEIENELDSINLLFDQLIKTAQSIPRSKVKRQIYEESIALKLHNFYTGCERIFRKIADSVNGGTPDSYDWHIRLLNIMSLELDKIRPPVISKKTASLLKDFLGFRHVIRNIYGFELDSERLTFLLNRLPAAVSGFQNDISKFITFLKKLEQ
ncbi:MAG: hypothetical protein GF401_20440 [Chitinivibrionales bacterium]|nr:hypothetical protein [Chitinivibrionales bacterium]